MEISKKFLLTLVLLTGSLFVFYHVAFAAATVTAATGGSAISADDTGGSWTTLTGPTITEGANKDVGTGTIVLSAPSGFEYNTGVTVTATITLDQGSKTCFTFTSTTATPGTSTITFTVNAQDGTGGNPATTCHVTFSNIQVRPTAGTPLASGNITHTGTASITGVTGSTNFGTLTEVIGSITKVGINTQPSSTATVDTEFGTYPSVGIQDQWGNNDTNKLNSWKR